MGRPSDYSDDMASAICSRIAEGESLRTICHSEDMPARSTVFSWLSTNEAFQDHYARARKNWAETQLEEILSIADDEDLKPDDKRVRIDTRKWAMGKLNGKYSDKVKHVGGDDGDSPIAFTGFDVRFV